MWLQHTELCHEIPDGTEAQSSCLRTISSANRTTYTAAPQKSLAVSSGLRVWPWTCYLGNTQSILEFFSWTVCSPPLTEVMSLLESFVGGYDRIQPRKAVLNGDTLFHSGFSFTADEFISADIGCGRKVGYTDGWHLCLRNLYPREETAMLSKR